MELQPAYPNKPDLEPQSINTEGVVAVGEINSRAMREAQTAADYQQALISGAAEAYRDVQMWAEEAIRRAGPYDDTRALKELVAILGDKIRDVHSRATAGDTHA